MITINSQTREITRGPNYWVMKHFTHAARKGSKVVDTRGDVAGIGHVAFLNPDGSKSLVLSNTASDRKLQIRSGAATTDLALPANSLTTLTWR
jgi:glucosylceramidase